MFSKFSKHFVRDLSEVSRIKSLRKLNNSEIKHLKSFAGNVFILVTSIRSRVTALTPSARKVSPLSKLYCIFYFQVLDFNPGRSDLGLCCSGSYHNGGK